MKQNTAQLSEIKSLDHLASAIQNTNQVFLKQAQKQVNKALTIRNWLIGLYIVEYEQQGEDRASYGELIFKKLAVLLKNKISEGYLNLHYIYADSFIRYTLKLVSQ